MSDEERIEVDAAVVDALAARVEASVRAANTLALEPDGRMRPAIVGCVGYLLLEQYAAVRGFTLEEAVKKGEMLANDLGLEVIKPPEGGEAS